MKCFYEELVVKEETPAISKKVKETTILLPTVSRSTKKKSSPGVSVPNSEIKKIEHYQLNDLNDDVEIAGVDVKHPLVEYRRKSLECVKNHSFTDQQLLSLSNIVLLSQSSPLEFLDKQTSASVYASLTAPLFSSLPSLSVDVLNQTKPAFTAYAANNDTLPFSRTFLSLPEISSIHCFVMYACC
ncbi:uncharacterized protein B0P05DRAFT_638895 [Gilbertella persicaria]|uniref:Uncharacterized protein n=1 Tax=Rhizopus stolonifer TaxID=4846 RepID=A0A367IV00_RHIST|nr:uncharacterized protein B0P05DRAFT_638895 [Gilbertella persicaria]KAI8073473.1 hypothetical protein B0P05DRAFT_638895 [Gilbertella persicaria]RCH81508.1 hypothetical protein CU098_006725 [Rhizopus stolonifer]